MEKERIKQLAVEAGLVDSENAFGQLMIAHGPYNDELERFAQAVARECAKLCDDDGTLDAAYCAQAIRARFGLGE